MISALGSSARTIGARLSEPRIIVSSRPRAWSMPVGEDVAALGVGAELRLVERDEGESRGFGVGIDSAVHRNQRASGGRIFSSPVISATWFAPFSVTTRS